MCLYAANRLDTMMLEWHRKRHPDDVPTPVAVALADFCRRAKAPASAAAVRDALSFLDGEQDAPLRKLTDAEPTLTPLGPFAVVDIVRGEKAAVASEREKSGFYEDVRKKARAARKTPPPAPPVLTASAPAPKPSAKPPPKRSAPTKKRKTKATLAERVAPKKRAPGTVVHKPRPTPPPPATAYLPKRNLPAPRGRFSVVDPSRVSLDTLTRPQSRETLEALITQSPTRYDLLKTLAKGYTGRRGAPVSIDDVEALLDRTQLAEGLARRELDVVLGAVGDQRGALGRSAAGLGLKLDELIDLIDALHLRRKVEDLRAGFIREALDPNNLVARLDLLRRRKYLEDLDIVERFEAALVRDLTAALDASAESDAGGDLVERTARARGLPEDLLRRAVERLEVQPSPAR